MNNDEIISNNLAEDNISKKINSRLSKPSDFVVKIFFRINQRCQTSNIFYVNYNLLICIFLISFIFLLAWENIKYYIMLFSKKK